MRIEDFELVASLQALPETDPIEIDGIQFGDCCNNTCQSQCDNLTVNVIQTVCAVFSTC
jgi:hypothetical protein